MNLTKRNHYNPCLWTALWNEAYHARIVSGVEGGLSPRSQRVHALSVRSGAVYSTAVENVFFEKNLGLAEMTPASMKDFCRRWFPDDYPEVARDIDEHPDTLVLDFENHFGGIEKHGHPFLLEAARHGRLTSVHHKGFVTCLVITQAMRSHEFMSSMVARTSAAAVEKWEYFWILKQIWSDRVALARAVAPLAGARWTLYRTEQHRFPLCDSPVMINRGNVMMTLTPRLLAEIDLTAQAPEDKWVVQDGISASKFREFRRRSIQNTFKDIIFANREELETWKTLPEFRTRVRNLSTREGREQACDAGARRVMWALSGFGRVPDDFEDWMEPIMDKAIAATGPLTVSKPTRSK
jgi:hypothetical protein